MTNFLNRIPTCLDATPTFLGLFDMSVAPPLLFYSYIPIFLMSTVFGLIIYRNNPKSTLNKIFFAITLSFASWIILILTQWTAVHTNIVHFAWQALIAFEFSIYALSAYFVYVFVYKKEFPKIVKNILFAITTAVILLIPTSFNIEFFDITHCEGVVGTLWDIQYLFEVITIICLIAIAYSAKYNLGFKINSAEFLTPLGVIIFLTTFFLSNLFGELTKIYNINLIGPIGMFLFLALLSYVIVKYNSLNTKLFGAQVLVGFQWIFIVAIFFIQNISYIQLVVAITMVISLPLGFFIVRSVKREIEQRERIEKLAKDLEVANEKLRGLDQLKTEFLSLATHQIRSPLTAIKGYSSMLLEGDFGALPVRARESVKTIFASCQHLINIVEDFLNISRIEQGRMTYNKENLDLKPLVAEAIKELLPNAEKKNLKIDLRLTEQAPITINADRGKIKQVLHDILDNAIKYTKAGQIEVQVLHDRENAEVVIKDTGVGMDQKDLEKLFVKFSRASDAYKHNVSGTGLGLYIAQKMIEAHNGKILAQSLGRGKGSTFTIVLPLARS